MFGLAARHSRRHPDQGPHCRLRFRGLPAVGSGQENGLGQVGRREIPADGVWVNAK
jgi:hypothetical protein